MLNPAFSRFQERLSSIHSIEMKLEEHHIDCFAKEVLCLDLSPTDVFSKITEGESALSEDVFRYRSAVYTYYGPDSKSAKEFMPISYQREKLKEIASIKLIDDIHPNLSFEANFCPVIYKEIELRFLRKKINQKAYDRYLVLVQNPYVDDYGSQERLDYGIVLRAMEFCMKFKVKDAEFYTYEEFNPAAEGEKKCRKFSIQ